MKVVFNSKHIEHAAEFEFFRGEKVPAFEKVLRADFVLEAVRDAKVGEVISPQSFPDNAITRVHSERYVNFIRTAHEEYAALGGKGDAFPSVWPIRGMRSNVEPKNFAAKMGLYSFDSGTPFTRGAYAAARTGADCALTGASLLRDGHSAAFVLTRPPGHHAGSDFFGGYCFLNNAAIAAQSLLDHGAKRVAILDVDYHHGNGTQDIFYSRDDVFFASIHADPATDYPFFLGYTDETGTGDGAGFNLNLPLAQGASPDTWFAALDVAIAKIAAFKPDALVVSLGVDTFENDPISHFKLRTREDYPRMGVKIRAMNMPTIFILEGGYAVKEIGDNVVAVLAGFERV